MQITDADSKTRGIRAATALAIRVELAKHDMSATELARRTGLSQQALSRRMTGDVPFNIDELDLIATTLNVPVTNLVRQVAAVAA